MRQSYYSVPARLAGRRVQVALGADWLDRHDGDRVVARHTRSLHKGSEDLVLDHYLEVLRPRRARWPGPPRWSAPGARRSFTDAHQRFWDDRPPQAGDRDGTRALIGVLLLHRTLPTRRCIAGMTPRWPAGRCDPDLVAVQARRHLADRADRHRRSAACRRQSRLLRLTGRYRRWTATTSCWQEAGA